MASLVGRWYRVVYPDEWHAYQTVSLLEPLGPEWTQDLATIGQAVRAAHLLGVRVRVEYAERRWAELSAAAVAEALPEWCHDGALTAETAPVGTWVRFYDDARRWGRVETPPDAEGRVGVRWRGNVGMTGDVVAPLWPRFWCCAMPHPVALAALRALPAADVATMTEVPA